MWKILILVDLQWTIWIQRTWTEKNTSYSCHHCCHCININYDFSHLSLLSKKKTWTIGKIDAHYDDYQLSKSNSKESGISHWKRYCCLFDSFDLHRNFSVQVRSFSLQKHLFNPKCFRVPIDGGMNQFPYAYFVLEHMFICPLIISAFMGCVALYQHGKVLKRSILSLV